jgi:hypothetical protein
MEVACGSPNYPQIPNRYRRVGENEEKLISGGWRRALVRDDLFRYIYLRVDKEIMSDAIMKAWLAIY